MYNWRNSELVHKTHGMVELENYQISKAENSLNLGAHRFYKILQGFCVVARDIDGNVFHVNNYIDWDSFNQLYDPAQQIKETRIANFISQMFDAGVKGSNEAKTGGLGKEQHGLKKQ